MQFLTPAVMVDNLVSKVDECLPNEVLLEYNWDYLQCLE